MPVPALPDVFGERMAELLAEEYPAFCSSYESSRTNGLRVNTLKVSVEEFKTRTRFPLEPIPWAPDGFYYDYIYYPGQHPYHSAGVYYLQEPSAMAVVYYLDPQPGEKILDLAAAPGGKSTQIASRLNTQGLLWANEIHPGRARILAGNLERWGAPNVIVSNETPDHLAERLPGFFDRVLLDAPCSGEGMFRKDPNSIREWSPENVLACAQRQSLILESAARLVKPGGRLVYSTCTFSLAENEETILKFLEAHPDFKPLALPDPSPGFVHPQQLPEAVRLYPHRIRGEGHFIAALERTESNSQGKQYYQAAFRPHKPKREKARGNSPGNSSKSKQQREKNPSLAEFLAFAKTTLSNDALVKLKLPLNLKQVQEEAAAEHFIYFAEHLYLNPVPYLSLDGLSIVRPGLHLGAQKPGRFEPGYALALALNPDSVNSYLFLTPDDPRLKKYLRGESWEESGPDGWVLVGVDEFPLGWAKRVKGELKNHYPKELRQRI